MQSIRMEVNTETTITRASAHQAEVLSELGARTFWQSHKDSAPAHEIERYTKKVYNLDVIKSELNNPVNIYHVLTHGHIVAGFSKIEVDMKHPLISLASVTKMDQIYLDESLLGQGLGAKLLHHNIEYSKSHGENGMWLVVWLHNHTAIAAYKKFGFRVIAQDKFQLTESHQNPCYVMLLDYSMDIHDQQQKG